MKKLLTVLLSVLMVLTLGTINVLADEEVEPEILVSFKLQDGSSKEVALNDFTYDSYSEHYTVAYTLDGEEANEEAIKEAALAMIPEDYTDPAEELPAGVECDELHPHIAIGEEGSCYGLKAGEAQREHTHSMSNCGGETQVYLNQFDKKYYKNNWYGQYSNPVTATELDSLHEKEDWFGNTYWIYKCNKLAHTHDDSCYELKCNKEEHLAHTLDCYKVTVALDTAYAPVQYKVIFDAFGGAWGEDNKKEALTGANDETAFKVEVPENPTRDGYTFEGWVTNPETFLERQYDFTKPVTASVTVYAKWYHNTISIVDKDGKDLEGFRTTYGLTAEDRGILENYFDGYWNKRVAFNLNFAAADNGAVEAIEKEFVDNEEAFQADDITIQKVYYGSRWGREGWQEEVIETSGLTDEIENGYVYVPVDISEAPTLKKGYTRAWYVRSYHNDEVKELDFTINGDTLTYKANQFSTFEVSYVDTKKPTPTPIPFVAPKTGD